MTRTILFAILLTLLGATASAAKLKVPSEYPNIHSAVTPAQPGDVVVIDEDVYYESVDALDKVGVTIRGKGKVIIDAGGSLYGIRIHAGIDVTLKNLRVRNAGMEGIDVASSSHVTIENCDVRNTGLEGIRASGYAIRIDGNTIRKTGGNAVHLTAYESVVCGNTISDLHGVAAAYVDAFGVVVSKNKISDITDRGIRVAYTAGPALTVIADNKIKNAWYGIAVDNSVTDVTIIGNRITKAGVRGVDCRGSSHAVLNNQITKPGNIGIGVYSAGSVVSGNDVQKPTGRGIYIYGDGNTVDDNTVEHAEDTGVWISSSASDNLICNNVARKSKVWDLWNSAGMEVNTLINNKFKKVWP